MYHLINSVFVMPSYDYRELIVKRLFKRISLRESEALNKWLLASAENRRIYQEMRDQFERSANTEYFVHSPNPPREKRTIQSSSPVQSQKKNGLISVVMSRFAKIFRLILPQRRFRATYIAFAMMIFLVSVVYIWQGRVYRQFPVEIRTQKTEQKKLDLTDGSMIKLSADSHVRYWKDFSDSVRTVYFGGYALFIVANDEKRPFIVATETATVLAYQATFAVWSRMDSIRIVVEEGRVSVRAVRPEDSDVVVLNRNEMTAFRAGENPPPPQKRR